MGLRSMLLAAGAVLALWACSSAATAVTIPEGEGTWIKIEAELNADRHHGVCAGRHIGVREGSCPATVTAMPEGVVGPFNGHHSHRGSFCGAPGRAAPPRHPSRLGVWAPVLHPPRGGLALVR